MRERVVVVGLGEVGMALYELLEESGKFEVYGQDVNMEKMQDLQRKWDHEKIDVMHICLPYKTRVQFCQSVGDYANLMKPDLIIINSTVPVGTTAWEISPICPKALVAHSPVRGVHKSREFMKCEIRRYTKYIGGANRLATEATERHFQKAGLKTKILKHSDETELAKLCETTYYGWLITCFQEMHRMADFGGLDFLGVVDFLKDTNKVRGDRPIMYPDVIRGHCVIPNVKLLLEHWDSQLLHLILNSNERRKREIEHKEVREVVDAIKRMVGGN